MAFKKEGAEFTDAVKFKDYALSFAAEEASRFSNKDGDVASAKVDFALSSAASLSASKHKAKIRELRQFLKEKEIKDAAGNSGTGTKGRGVIAPHVMVVLLYLSVFMILVSLIAGMFTSISTVTTTVTGFISKYSGRGSIIAEESLDEEEIDEIVEDSGATGRQKAVIRYALSKVGYPYSQADRTSGSAYDCSSLAYYCWRVAGVDISYGDGYPPTAAAEASKLYSKGEVVNSTRLDIKDMEPGDLIFYGGHDNGRFLGIYHVAVYVGNGEVVEAFNEKHGVVYQTLRTKNIILVLRP